MSNRQVVVLTLKEFLAKDLSNLQTKAEYIYDHWIAKPEPSKTLIETMVERKG